MLVEVFLRVKILTSLSDWKQSFAPPLLFYILDLYHHAIRAYISNICTTICRNIAILRSLCHSVLAKTFNNQLSRKKKCAYIYIYKCIIKFIMCRTQFTERNEICNTLYCKFHMASWFLKNFLWFFSLNFYQTLISVANLWLQLVD